MRDNEFKMGNVCFFWVRQILVGAGIESSEGPVCEKDAETGKVQVCPHHWAFDLLWGGFLPAFSLSQGFGSEIIN